MCRRGIPSGKGFLGWSIGLVLGNAPSWMSSSKSLLFRLFARVGVSDNLCRGDGTANNNKSHETSSSKRAEESVYQRSTVFPRSDFEDAVSTRRVPPCKPGADLLLSRMCSPWCGDFVCIVNAMKGLCMVMISSSWSSCLFLLGVLVMNKLSSSTCFSCVTTKPRHPSRVPSHD